MGPASESHCRITAKIPSQTNNLAMPRNRNEHTPKGHNRLDDGKTTRICVAIRGVDDTESLMPDIQALVNKWNPNKYESIPPLEMWALCLGVEPSTLTAKFMHRHRLVNILLDVARTDDD